MSFLKVALSLLCETFVLNVSPVSTFLLNSSKQETSFNMKGLGNIGWKSAWEKTSSN